MKKEKNPKKLKCYVLTISKTFPSTHPRAGQTTNFLDNILKEVKKHTIRLNYDLWKKRIDEVNAGLAYISVRSWSGKPYNSKQTELLEFTGNSIGIQKLTIDSFLGIFIDNVSSEVKPIELAENDGLNMQDFNEWFKPIKFNEPYAIIHFTNFRYEVNKDECFIKID